MARICFSMIISNMKQLGSVRKLPKPPLHKTSISHECRNRLKKWSNKPALDRLVRQNSLMVHFFLTSKYSYHIPVILFHQGCWFPLVRLMQSYRSDSNFSAFDFTYWTKLTIRKERWIDKPESNHFFLFAFLVYFLFLHLCLFQSSRQPNTPAGRI